MIDEPLALLAEAFGQDPAPVILPHAGGGTMESLRLLSIVGAAPIGKAEGLRLPCAASDEQSAGLVKLRDAQAI